MRGGPRSSEQAEFEWARRRRGRDQILALFSVVGNNDAMNVTISEDSIDSNRPGVARVSWGVAMVLALSVGLGACQGDDQTPGDDAGSTQLDAASDAPDGSVADGTDEPGGPDGKSDTSSSEPDDAGGEEADTTVSCTPGEILRCNQENTKSVVKCQEDGTGTIPSSCQGTSVCREGECVDVFCVPDRGRCQQKQAQRCNEKGTKWVDTKTCGADQQCSRGRCIDRCENAAQKNSYIGCEYWAVELENHLLFEENEEREIPKDRTPPFAIVLANTRDYDAEVTVWASPGKYAEAVGSRTVGTDIRRPDVTLQTVHSELVDQQGNRLIKDPISGPIKNVPLPSDSLLTLILPHREIPDSKTTLKDVAYKVESSQPVVAYQYNPYCCNYNYTNDASLLLPKSALTGNYMYMSAPVWNHPKRREGDSSESPTISVLATEPDTEVTVQLRDPDGDMRSYDDVVHPIQNKRVSGPDDQGRIDVTMDPFEVLNIAGKGIGGGAAEDFTGARIEANKPISAFGAHSCTFIPFYQAACDHLESQLQPMETWGTRFVASPLKLRAPDNKGRNREGTYWKFVARKDGTQIETGLNLKTSAGEVLPASGEGTPTCADFTSNPTNGVFTLDAGESCEFGTKKMFVATATRPVLMGAFLSGQESVGENVDFAGDPAFYIVPPVVQYRTSYSFLTPETYKSDYVTVTIRGSNATQFQLDGETIDVSTLDTYQTLPNANFSRVHIPVEPGPHEISANVDFGIVAYGYHDYVSYAYTGGLDLAKRNQIE
jgi:hypothetical protein